MVLSGNRYGNWALVAGAAEGLGEGFSMILAEKGFHLILVDRNREALQQMAEKVSTSYHIQTLTLHVDLAAPDAASRCMELVAETDCRLMVYVAAWSRVCRFTELSTTELDGFLAVNTRTLLHLVHGFSSRLTNEGKTGGMILVSSLAGLIGPKYVATYAATKAFAIRLTEALHGELKQKGIDISVCCAGTISTPTYWLSKPSFKKMKPPVMQPMEVAAFAVSCLGKKIICIPGLVNRLQYFFLLNLIPRRLANRLVHDAMEKMYGHGN